MAMDKHKNLWAESASLFVFPCTVSILATCLLEYALWITKPAYGLRSGIFAAVLCLIWIVAFVFDQRRVNNDRQHYMQVGCGWIIAVFFAGLTAWFLTSAAWDSGYLTLAPFEAVDNGYQHLDTLFHSAVAESYKRSVVASSLLNDERYLPYHTFSHFLMGNLSKLMGMPSLIAYSFLFPIFFLPLYILAQLLAVSAAKRYFEGSAQIHFLDLIMVVLFLVGVVKNDLLDAYAIKKISYINSESFLVANTMAFLSYGLAFYVLCRFSENRKVLQLFCTFVLPLEIFLISWAKISVGFIFAGSVMYFIFRMKMKELRFWILNFLYLAVFLVCMKLFAGESAYAVGEEVVKNRFFAFGDYCTGSFGVWGHYAILLFMPGVFFLLEFLHSKFGWEAIKSAGTIWVEEMLICIILAFLPGMVLSSLKVNAAYFSYAVEVPALVLLCGHNYIDLKNWKVSLRLVTCVLCIAWCVQNVYTNSLENPLNWVTGSHKTNLSETLLQMRKEVCGHPEKYTIYLEKNTFISDVFSDSRSACYISPAMTGIGVINGSYRHEDVYYTFRDEPVTANYALNFIDHDRLDFQEALSCAKKMGKEAVIHITEDGYEYIKCQ